MQWIVKEPFPGHAESVLNKDGTVAYTDGLTFAGYQKRESDNKLRIIDDSELDKLVAVYCDKMITNPKRTTKKQFWYALEVLPPSRYHKVRDCLVFHVCERITYDLVDWYAEIGDKFYHWVDHSSISDSVIADKLGGINGTRRPLRTSARPRPVAAARTSAT